MVSVTGSLATCGGGSRATWKLNLSNLRWTQLNPTGTAPFYGGGLAGTRYDPDTGDECRFLWAPYHLIGRAHALTPLTLKSHFPVLSLTKKIKFAPSLLAA